MFSISNFPTCHQTEVKIGAKFNFDFFRKSYGFDTDTEIQPWFWFLILKPNFCLTLHTTVTLLQVVCSAKCHWQTFFLLRLGTDLL